MMNIKHVIVIAVDKRNKGDFPFVPVNNTDSLY